MLLQDATSEREVEEVLAGARGDEEAAELRTDIETELDYAMRRFDEHFYKYVEPSEPTELRDFVQDNDGFIDELISDSAQTTYDLSIVPREDVVTAVRWEVTSRRSSYKHRFGIFELGEPRDVDASGFSYDMPTEANVVFPDRLLPTNYEFVPREMATEFWKGIAHDHDIEWYGDTDRLGDNQGSMPGEPLRIGVAEDRFEEWCRDLIAEHANKIAEQHPDQLIEMFWTRLRQSDVRMAAEFKAMQPRREDVLDLAVQWISGNHDDVAEEIAQYLDSAKERGEAEKAEYEPVDSLLTGEPIVLNDDVLRQLGVTSGVFWEERPWHLVRLEARDLGREGRQMRHCVGDKGMGYIRALNNGEIEVWSLRSRDDKPRFTLQVDASFFAKGATPETRGKAIQQVKGKANRVPGYADAYGRSGNVKFPEEIVIWSWIFEQLMVDPLVVEDFKGYKALPSRATPLASNMTGQQCVGFDLPYRPLR